MNTKESAFPLVEPVNSGATVHPGMTLRDWFAGQALTGIIALDYGCEPNELSHDAYLIADAMLEYRKE